jgi:hypothetical protein
MVVARPSVYTIRDGESGPPKRHTSTVSPTMSLTVALETATLIDDHDGVERHAHRQLMVRLGALWTTASGRISSTVTPPQHHDHGCPRRDGRNSPPSAKVTRTPRLWLHQGRGNGDADRWRRRRRGGLVQPKCTTASFPMRPLLPVTRSFTCVLLGHLGRTVPRSPPGRDRRQAHRRRRPVLALPSCFFEFSLNHRA